MTWGEFDRRANAFAADLIAAGLQHQSKVAAYLYNGARVPRDLHRRVQGRLRAGQHELPLRAGRDRLPVRQRRRRGRRVPRDVHRRCSRASAVGCRRCAAGTSCADETGAGPEWAVPYESVVATGADRVVAPWGAQRRRPAAPLHRRHHRHAEGRDVAAGRPVQRARRRRQRRCSASPPATSAVEAGDRLRADPDMPPAVMLVGVPADARHRPVLVAHHDEPRRHGRDAAEPQVRRRRAVADVSSDRQVNSVVIVGQAFAGRCCERLDANPGKLRPVERSRSISSSGVMWSQENKERPAAAHAPGDAVRLVRLVGGRRARRVGVGDGRPRARRPRSCSANASRCSPRTAGGSSRAAASRHGRRRAASSRSATTRTRSRRRRRSDVRGPALERSRATGPRSTPTARCTCSAAARCASTRAARRSSPRRSRRC